MTRNLNAKQEIASASEEETVPETAVHGDSATRDRNTHLLLTAWSLLLESRREKLPAAKRGG